MVEIVIESKIASELAQSPHLAVHVLSAITPPKLLVLKTWPSNSQRVQALTTTHAIHRAWTAIPQPSTRPNKPRRPAYSAHDVSMIVAESLLTS